MLRTLLIVYFLLAVTSHAVAQTPSDKTIDELLLKFKNSKSDTLQVDLLLQLSDCYFVKPHRQATDLSTAFIHLRSAEALSNKLQYQRGLGNCYRQFSKFFHQQNDSAKGRNYSLKSIEVFKANNNLMDLGEAWFDLSGYYSLYGNDLKERIRLVEQSLATFQQAHSKQKEADVYKELGDLRSIQGDYGGALSDLRRALQLYQSIGHAHIQGTYDLMGSVSADLGDFEHALQYGLLALKTAEQVGDTGMQKATIYNRVGLTYESLKKYQQAYESFEKSLSIAVQYKHAETIIILSCNISKILDLLNKPNEALTILKRVSAKYPVEDNYLQMLITSHFLTTYLDLKQDNEAQQYCEKLLKLSGKFEQNDPDQSLVYPIVAKYYLQTHQYVPAQKYLAINHAFCLMLKWPLGLSENHLAWFKLDSMQGKYLPAILHYQRYKAIGDSLLNEATGKQVEQLQVQYETEKKDRDIILKAKNIQLLTKHAQLQHAQLKQTRFTQNVMLVGTVLLLIILVLLYNHSRQRHKTNKLLVNQQKEINQKNVSLQHLVDEKEWLVKEIHHRVKNNFHMVMGLLGTQSNYLKNEEALLAISESQHRIHAMSLIHQKLYQSETLSAVNVPEYINELVEYLKESFDIRYRIHFTQNIEAIELDLAHAVPLGLILNEAITNSIKYAFAQNKEGNIAITLKHKNEEELLLVIADDGIGVPVNFDAQKSDSMGMNLMQGLSEDIGGSFEIKNVQGTHVEVVFIYVPGVANHQHATT